MLVLANEMFDSPPVFAWVLPVFVRLQPGKEETFSPASRSRIFVFSTHVSRRSRHTTMQKGGGGKGTGKCKGKPEEEGQRGGGRGSAADMPHLVAPDHSEI